MHSIGDQQITYFARTNYRDHHALFGIKRADRLFHMYIIGKTGTGKTTLLETLVLQDIHNGEGLTIIDPHGDMVSEIARNVPDHRKDDLIYFNAPDPAQPYGYNPFAYVVPGKRALAASGILEVFRKHWGEQAWGQRMEHILRNALLAVLELSGVTLLDLVEFLRNDAYRKQVLPKITNEHARRFFEGEFAEYTKRYRADALAPIQNKIGAFLADPVLRRILTTPERPIDLRAIMDEGKVLLVNLSKGRLGEDTAGLLGALLATSLGLAGFSRADVPPEKRRLHFVYMDEFQNVTTLSMANMLSEIRKQNIALTLGHQFMGQIKPEIRDAVIGNVGTLITFRLGAQDASYIARELHPYFEPADAVHLPNRDILLKLMIDGVPSKPFSATTIVPQHMSSLRVKLTVKQETEAPPEVGNLSSVVARD